MGDLFENQRLCQYCRSILKGRSDKKFCNTNCKNAFHNPINRERKQKFKYEDQKLHHNHTVLRKFYELSKGVEFIKLRLLLLEGFDPRYFIGTMRERETGESVHIVYDYAFYYDQNNGIKIYFNEGNFHNL